jgi:hypothetical protein
MNSIVEYHSKVPDLPALQRLLYKYFSVMIGNMAPEVRGQRPGRQLIQARIDVRRPREGA